MKLSSRVNIKHILQEIQSKNVVMRVDFNVPLEKGQVKDVTRVASTIETLNCVREAGAQNLVLLSHLGRPQGRPQDKYSLKPVVPVLEELLQKKVTFVEDCMQPGLEAEIRRAKDSVFLLENVRFYPEEEGKGVDLDGHKFKATPAQVASFRQTLTSYGDIYVNDAFGTSHRAHSSIVGVDLPRKAAGLLLKKELDYFGKALEHPTRPLLVVLGGAKVSDKIQLITNILSVADELIIGGAMAFTFLRVLHNMPLGDSKYDPEGAKLVPEIMRKAKERNVKITLPVDFLCGDAFSGDCQQMSVSREEGIPEGWMGLDCGPETRELNREAIQRASTIICNGPQGVFEMAPFAQGSQQLVHDIVRQTQEKNAISIMGGGDTVSLVQQEGVSEQLSHVSTGGGASLELLEGKQLPGVTILDTLS